MNDMRGGRGRWRRIRQAIVVAVLGMVFVGPLAAQAPAIAQDSDTYYLRKGDVVLMLGDGVTADKANAYYGFIFYNDLNTRYPDLVQRDGVPAKEFDGPGVKFINAGLKGETAAGGLKRLDDLLTKNKPTVCVVCYGVADLLADRAGYQENLRKIVQKLKAAKVDVTILTAPSVCTFGHPDVQKYLDTMGQMADEAKKVATDEGVGFADCYTPLRALQDKHEKDFTTDGRHPTRDAQAVIAAAIEEAWGFGKPLGSATQPRHRAWPSQKGSSPTSSLAAAVQSVTSQAAASQSSSSPAPQAGEPGWVNVTGVIGGDKWGIGGVTLVASVPGLPVVVVGVADAGMWSSADAGATWRQRPGSNVISKGRLSQIVFDPKNPMISWVAMVGGPGLFRTNDAGVTFERLGDLESVAGMAVDLGDEAHKTILAGLAGKPRSLYRTTNGGKKWENMGQFLPADASFTTDPIILDDQTYIVNSAGADLDLSFGIYRSDDRGSAWKKVSDFGPTGRPLLTADGAIYWARIWSQGLIKSADGGKTWTALEGPVKKTPIEVPGNRLVGFDAQQLYFSADGGKTWKPCGPKLPILPSGIAYNDAGNAIYAWWSSGDRKVDNAIWRIDLPKDLNAFFGGK